MTTLRFFFFEPIVKIKITLDGCTLFKINLSFYLKYEANPTHIADCPALNVNGRY